MRLFYKNVLCFLIFMSVILINAPVANAVSPGFIDGLIRTWSLQVFENSSYNSDQVVKYFSDYGYKGLPSSVASQIIEKESTGAIQESLDLLLKAFAAKVDDPEGIDTFVDTVVFPGVDTLKTLKTINARKAKGEARLLSGKMRYEKSSENGVDGDLYGISLGVAKDYENFSYGVVIPYDHTKYEEGDLDQYGAILFGQYASKLSDQVTAKFTLNVNYLYSDFSNAANAVGYADDYSSIGYGVSASLGYDAGTYAGTVFVGYYYNQYDLDVDDDHKEQFKVGGNVGLRFGDDAAATIYGIYNVDATKYNIDLNDDDYFDVGVEAVIDVSEVWNISAGYRKVIDLKEYDADQIYLGTSLMY